MVIEIPDNVSPKERRRLLKILPIKYALTKFFYWYEVAIFLGINKRCLYSIVQRNPELKEFYENRGPSEVVDGFIFYRKKKVIDEETRNGYLKMLKRYPDE